LPTPMAGNPGTEDYNAAGNTDSSRKTVELAGWGSPRAQEIGRCRSAEALARAKLKGGSVALEDQVHLASGQPTTSSPAGTGRRGVLNPEHSRWLQGYPPAWGKCGRNAFAAQLGR
jgi:hypothetical protein